MTRSDLWFILVHLILGLDLVGLGVRVLAAFVVPVDRRPSSAMAWMLAIVFLPYIGGLLYLIIGNTKLPASRRQVQREINRLIIEGTPDLDGVPDQDPGPEWLKPVVRLNRKLGALPLLTGNDAQLISGYYEVMQKMVDAIESAQVQVHCEFYIINLDSFTEPFFVALEDAAKRGVEVKVLLDHIASRNLPGYRKTIRRLNAAGVDWKLMLPINPCKGQYQRPDLRNHRKMLIVDHRVAFVGSQNLVDRTYHKRLNRKHGRLLWKELVLRLEGPIVSCVDAIFATDWQSEGGEMVKPEIVSADPSIAAYTLECQAVPSGPGFEGENNLKLFNLLLYRAQHRISITSPYFVPDESLLHAVTNAAERGVQVELFVSEVGDQKLVFHAQRSFYKTLLSAGVRIYLYPAPYILHAKHLNIDDQVCVVGSSNMDMRSFDLNLELSLLISGRDFAEKLARIEDDYRSVSRELTLQEHLATPWYMRALDNLSRLTSALQ